MENKQKEKVTWIEMAVRNEWEENGLIHVRVDSLFNPTPEQILKYYPELMLKVKKKSRN